MVVVLVGRRSVREISRCIFRWEGELGSKDDGDKPAVWLSQASMSRCTCQVGLLRSRWFGGCCGVVSPKHDGKHRCRNRIAVWLALSRPRPSFAFAVSLRFFLDQTAFSCAKAFPPRRTPPHYCYRETAVPRLTILAKRHCRVSLITQAEIYIATPVDFAGQGISQAHSPSFDCTAALTQHGSTPHHTTALTSSPPATPS
jgi:hypothetical protein